MRLPPLLVLGLALALALALAPRPAAAEGPPPAVPDSAAQIDLSFAPLVRRAAPAVVNIYASRLVADRASPFDADPFFRDFWGDLRDRPPRLQNALGSGVIVAADGLVVSNTHVVDGAVEIRVVLSDRREYAADILLADRDSDLALLRLRDAPPLPWLPLADSDAAQVGDLVLAIGNPFGVGQTVSSGIVSGLGRSSLAVGAGRGYFLQTDAAINPGNSGGALIDRAGRLLGINTAILTRGGGSNGVGFAVPANLVAQVLAQARAGATAFTRPWAGIEVQPLDMDMAQAMDLPRPEGVLVARLHPDSPFAAAGLRMGDLLLALDGHPVNGQPEVAYRLAVAGPGATLRAAIRRSGQDRTLTVVLAPAPAGTAAPVTVTADVALRGLTVAAADPAMLDRLRLPFDTTGVVVTDLADRAARTGLAPGDVIRAVNGRPVAAPADIAAAAQDRRRTWRLDVLRQGRPLRLLFRF